MKKITAVFIVILIFITSLDFCALRADAASFDLEEFSEYLYSEALKYNENIDISDYVKTYKWTTSDIKDNVGNAYLSKPELYFADNTFRIMYTESGSFFVSFRYLFSGSQKQRADEKMNMAAEKAVKNIKKSMSDVEKALIVHDYLILNCTYDNTNSRHSAYDCLVGGDCVCQGFSLAYKYILENYCGIKVSMCYSKSQNHIWNYVQINGKWYHVDLTADNPTYSLFGNKSADGYGEVHHDNFLISDSECKKTSGLHRNWEVIGNYGAATDKTYDNYFWKGCNSPICYDNGLYYYLIDDPSSPAFSEKNKSDEISVNLYSYSFKKKKSTLLSKFASVWYVQRTVSNGKTYEFGKAWYKRSFSKLAVSDGYLYINTAKSIFRYRIKDGKTQKIYTLKKGNNQIYSIMMINDNAIRVCYKYDNTYDDNYIKVRLN